MTRLGRVRAGAVMAATAAAALVLTSAPGFADRPATNPSASNGHGQPGSDAPRHAPGQDRGRAILLLDREPLATSSAVDRGRDGRVLANGNRTGSEQARLAAQRNEVKKWLRANAPGVQVTGEHVLALNALTVQLPAGASLDSLRAAPHVVSAQYEQTYSPSDDNDPDLGLINAIDAWRAGPVGGDADAGALPDGTRIKVAVVDTGIDVTHPCFADGTFPATRQLGDKRFTNNKVIVAKVFANRAAQQGLTAEAIQDHGTHVAGTIGCDVDTPATVADVDVPYAVSGVAPAVQLGSYNVFPGHVDDARSEDILNALEAAYADGMDVANMSLGGDAHGIQDLLTIAVDNLDRAGMVVAVAAGNSGPGHDTVESPGSAQRALTAGASTVGHYVGAPVTVGSFSTGAASGDFETVKTDLSAPLAVVPGTAHGLDLACAALPAGSLTGEIALVSRGSCTFSTKVKNAQDAGAAAVLVVNNVAGDPAAMATDPAVQPAPTIPAYQVGLAEGVELAAHGGEATTIGAAQSYIRSANDNIMAGFSSQGPTDVDRRVKPDVVAPGVNVLSSVPHFACEAPPCWAFFQGTSMATPHLAGSAAVVLDALRSAGATPTAEQVRSAIVNTATTGVLTAFQTGTSAVQDVNVTGAGLENLLAAVNAEVAVGPVSTSFGRVPSGSGQTRTATIRLSSLDGHSHSVVPGLSPVGPTGGVSYAVSPAAVAVPASGEVTLTVTMKAVKGAAPGGYAALLTLSEGATALAHSVVFTEVG